jgi:excisionase family DNA binding protein
MDNQDLLTAREVAYRLGISPCTVRAWARQGKIPAHHLSDKVIGYRFVEVAQARLAPRTRRKGDTK